MKLTLKLPALMVCAALAIAGCNKSSNNYSSTDHTVGMLTPRQWTGVSSGFTPGDSTIGITVHHGWPVHFSRNIADTTAIVQKIDGFTIKVMGTTLAWRTTDSAAGYVRYDTVLSGSAVSTFIFYYAADSMTFDYHKIESHNDSAGRYIETNTFWHTKHS